MKNNTYKSVEKEPYLFEKRTASFLKKNRIFFEKEPHLFWK
jgi:hypothetical protein